MIMWNIGALAKPLHEQAEGWGYRLKNYEFCEKVLFGIVAAHIHGAITDGEYNKILDRFFKKIVEPRLEEMKGEGNADRQTETDD